MKSRQKNLSRQSGTMLMGVVIGLVIGLSVAVLVALVITKTSTPFTNKNGKTDKSDAPITQMQDPNKPLYGNKDATKETAKEFVKTAENSKPAEVSEVKSEIRAEVKSPGLSTEKQIADTGEDKYIYFLQTGAFREVVDAESARAKLALIGFEARVSEKPSDTGNLYRVRIGPFNQLETMNQMRRKLSENSVDVAVVRTNK